jgi:hypothetical protein
MPGELTTPFHEGYTKNLQRELQFTNDIGHSSQKIRSGIKRYIHNSDAIHSH